MQRREFLKATGFAAGTLALNAPETSADRANETRAVSVTVRADQARGELKPIWRFFGADEPNYAYMQDGRKLLFELGRLGPQQAYFRTHNLLTSGHGKPALKWGSTGAYQEDAQGNPVYNWTILDRIFDAYIERSVKPYVQIGFMPKALSVKPEPYQHKWTPKSRYDEIYTGWSYPPKDYLKWAELAFQWTKHCVTRYGRKEVESWYWEVWNEPNIGYWQGTPDEFRKLHDHATEAVRRALPTARVGGPDTAGGGRFLREFLDHCLRGKNYATGKKGTPLEFVSFHAKGAPVFVGGHVRMGIANQLRTIAASLAKLDHDAVLDGEIVILDREGKAQFQLLQNHGTRQGVLAYYVFDLLYLDGHDLRGLPLLHRKELLAGLVADVPGLKVSEHIAERGTAFFEVVTQRQVEGMVAKLATSKYVAGERSRAWLKVKTQLRQQAIIGGFALERGSRSRLGALLLGIYRGKELVYIGSAGSGFNQWTLAEVREQLEPLIADACPFKRNPKPNKIVRWVRPELVCEISFLCWTSDGHVRHPVFQGMQEGLSADGVRREEPDECEAT